MLQVRNWGRRVLSVAAMVIIAACSDAAEQPLRVGVNPYPGYAPLFIAAEKNFFEEEGVVVELVEFMSLADVRHAFERGKIDGLTSTLVEVLEVNHASPGRLSIALVTDFSDGADAIFARPGISSVEDLKGQRVGIEDKTLNLFVLARALTLHGLNLDDVIVHHMPQNRMRSALELGIVDAVVSYPPDSIDLQEAGLAEIVFSSADIPGEVSDIVSFDSRLGDTRRAEIEAFKRAWGRSLDYMMAHPEDADLIMSRNTGISPEDFAELRQGVRIIGLEDQGTYLREDGQLQSAARLISHLFWPDLDPDEAEDQVAFVPSAAASPDGVW